MNKAILEIDMPDSCSKCPLFGDVYSDMCCKGLNNRGINYPYPKDFRQDWCPLRLVEEYPSLSEALEKYPLAQCDITDEEMKEVMNIWGKVFFNK